MKQLMKVRQLKKTSQKLPAMPPRAQFFVGHLMPHHPKKKSLLPVVLPSDPEDLGSDNGCMMQLSRLP
jgi:hypothetical protein